MLWKQVAIPFVFVLVPALLPAQEKVDLNMVHRIKTEAFNNSKVMETMHQLTDRYGPRLTNSKQFRAAGAWAAQQLTEWGLSSVKLEKWAAGYAGWDYTHFSGAIVEPMYQPIIGLPVAWTAGTNGPVTGEAILASVQSSADMDKWHGKLQGKIVLSVDPPELEFPATPLASRYSPDQLADLATELIPAANAGRGGRGGPAAGGRGGRGGANANQTPEQAQAFAARLRNFWKEEGVIATVQTGTRNQSGTFFGGGAQNRTDKTNLPQVVISGEHYNRIARLLQHNVPVKLMFDIKTEFGTDTDSFNVTAELPGNAKKDELVMVGGHFDSWHYGTGATDNAVGSAVAMETMRLLKALNVKMDRTVRLGLWGGEEQGLLGSRAYVKEHFADPTTMKPTTEHANFSGYFNIDNGTGRIRGVYLQGNEMMRPIFEAWFAPFKDLTPGTITIRNTGGTDHQAFDAVGLPGFQFIQDPMDYNTRTHHSNMDTYDRIQAADLKQMAAIEAMFVYNAATRPDKLPRKDLPPPQPGRGGRGGRGQ